MKKSAVKTVVFISNYFNHHQKPLAQAMYGIYGDGYKFIETEPMSEERKNMGWGESSYPGYVISSEEFNKNTEKYTDIIDNADIVIIGSAPNRFIENRIKNKKVIFRYTERPLKNNQHSWKNIIRRFTWRKFNPQNGYMQLLCSSAYASADYSKVGLYKNKAFKWGYFTEVKEYSDIDLIISEKEKNSLLWCARLIPLKHPETTVEIAKRLKNDGYDFKLNIIGSGEMEQSLRDTISKEKLEQHITLLGNMKPDQVRSIMEKSEIFFFTSDRNEGWGAVMNESMNSACAVVASHAIGAVPFLIKDKENGFIYEDGNVEDLYQKVKYLIDNPEVRKEMSKKAYFTIANEWNAKNAAKKFSKIADAVFNGEKAINIFEHGVCSKAEIIKDN